MQVTHITYRDCSLQRSAGDSKRHQWNRRHTGRSERTVGPGGSNITVTVNCALAPLVQGERCRLDDVGPKDAN
jgi:hypothetical protein